MHREQQKTPAMLLQSPGQPIGLAQVASQGGNAPLSRRLRIHSRFTPLTQKPSS